jgi:hypothetical protein
MIITTALGIGDLLYLKAAIDHAGKTFDINPAMGLIKWCQRNADYADFTTQLCQLLFPGHVVDNGPEFKSMVEVYHQHGLQCVKPNLAELLPQGQSLQKDYLVMTTKVRYLSKEQYKLDQLLQTIGNRQVVILGEREVELNLEYQIDQSRGCAPHSIYSELMKLPNKMDLTIPALGITSPDLIQYRQDALIMKEAKKIITLGIGGNFTTAISVGKTISYRPNSEWYSDHIFQKTYPDNFLTGHWPTFLQEISNVG